MTESEKEINNYILNYESIWSSISSSTAAKLRKHSVTVKYKKNETLYRDGAFPKGLYIIKSGIAKLQYINNEGRQQIIYILRQDEMFGYRSLISHAPSFIFITAVTNCEIEIIDKDYFLKMLKESTELNNYFMTLFAKEIRVLFHKLSFFAQKPINERIALSLLALAYKFNEKSSSNKIITFSKSDIACYAGTIQATLSRQLRILILEGIIKTSGSKIIILKEKQLLEVANL